MQKKMDVYLTKKKKKFVQNIQYMKNVRKIRKTLLYNIENKLFFLWE